MGWRAAPAEKERFWKVRSGLNAACSSRHVLVLCITDPLGLSSPKTPRLTKDAEPQQVGPDLDPGQLVHLPHAPRLRENGKVGVELRGEDPAHELHLKHYLAVQGRLSETIQIRSPIMWLCSNFITP